MGPPPLREDDEVPLVDDPLPEEPEAVLGSAAVTLIDAVADLPGSAMEAAEMVTADGEGTEAGAVYTPDVEIVPTVELPPAIPFTLQVTAVLPAAFSTSAVNVCVPLTVTLANTGLMDIDTAALIVTCAVAYFVVS